MSDQPSISFDALLPAKMAEKAENVGVNKTKIDIVTLFFLSILAGAFIGLGANFYTIVSTGSEALPFGVAKLLGGLVFCLGLILVVVAGAELFTGNNLIVMAVVSKKTTFGKLLYNWSVVYIGNFVGSVLTAYFIYLAAQYKLNGNAVGELAVKIANAKCSLPFMEAFFKAIYCNVLVCLAVWLCFSARTSTDKILCIIFPITAFVAGGFEHSVANMYFIPIGIFINGALGLEGMANLGWQNLFVKNLLPVTLGNIVGGVGFVGIIYWIIYCRNKKEQA